ncbi:hypothetical protein FSOLCH5_007992 [Fusarium solani]
MATSVRDEMASISARSPTASIASLQDGHSQVGSLGVVEQGVGNTGTGNARADDGDVCFWRKSLGLGGGD